MSDSIEHELREAAYNQGFGDGRQSVLQGGVVEYAAKFGRKADSEMTTDKLSEAQEYAELNGGTVVQRFVGSWVPVVGKPDQK